MSTLPNAVLALADAFNDIRRPKGVPCLWDISPEELSAYQHHEFDHGGWVAEYLYFLPRTMHAGVIEDDWWFIPEVTGQRIAETDPESWPLRRAEALDHFLTSVFESSRTRADTGSTIDSWICAIALMGKDVRPFLAKVEESHDLILKYYAENADNLNQTSLSNAFWKSSPDKGRQVVDWFLSKNVRDLIERSYGIRL
ncbi:hypothetical protein [Sulfuriroseicoccus oceanibius]|uniref:Uncharacterized protein n=1 Tax=Sulfuriroseicoccus oceanibius TaxID=2707525 RepID=A0A6B3LH41_9BACT|nr:hypothetical protein [Sulfuriroseicoccus oceanibius]QQL44073.1 hypothetical protein G3M56_009220 [Sulfuriroseicoccus oceanibius]